MKDRIIDIITTRNDNKKEKKLEELKKLFKINPTPIREGRQFPRVFKKTCKKFYMKKKRSI